MPWLQIKLDITPAQAPQLEDLLLSVGAVAVTLQDGADQPLFEPVRGTTPLWEQTRLTGLFDASIDSDVLLHQLQADYRAEFPDQPPLQPRLEILEDKDWEREWMDNFHPIQVGQRLWICPSWREAPDPAAVNLLLDPGLAFGTGTHPTTFMCLQWLDSHDLDGKTVVDYGCGSGILGIAALLLGARQVWGVDNDPQALIATRDNGQRNGLDAQRLEVFYPGQQPATQADIMVANILAGPLIDLAPTLAQLTRTGSDLVLSGILDHQAQAVMDAYSPWFDLDPPHQQEEWVRLSGRKR